MGRSAILYIVMGVALVAGTIIALAWWSLADKFFPGANRSTGQGLPRGPRAGAPKPTIVREADGPPPGPQPGA